MEYARLILSALVTAIVNLGGAFRRKRPPKLLVVKLDHLGDVVTATPVFRALRQGFPGAPIHALVGPSSSDLLVGNPFIDRVLTYDSERFRRPGPPRSPGGPLEAMREIAAQRYTHLVELRGDSWTLLLPFLAGAYRRVDRGTVRIASWLSRHAPRHDPGRGPLHEVETNLEVIRALVSPTQLPTPKVEIFLLDTDHAAAAARLKSLGISDGELLVTVHPGASWRPRAWRPERFAEVARLILDRYPVHVLFLGTAEDRDIADSIGAILRDRRAHFLFDARLRETAALTERSSLFIGNDSGIAHIAAACGTPVIALFGPQDPRRFGPWSERAVVLHQPVPCFPCNQTVCVRPENPCVNLNSVEEVIRNAVAVLGPAAETRSGT